MYIEDMRTLCIDQEKKRIRITLISDYSFECTVVEGRVDHVFVWVRRDQRKDFDIPRYVRYDAIAYLEPI